MATKTSSQKASTKFLFRNIRRVLEEFCRQTDLKLQELVLIGDTASYVYGLKPDLDKILVLTPIPTPSKTIRNWNIITYCGLDRFWPGATERITLYPTSYLNLKVQSIESLLLLRLVMGRTQDYTEALSLHTMLVG